MSHRLPSPGFFAGFFSVAALLVVGRLHAEEPPGPAAEAAPTASATAAETPVSAPPATATPAAAPPPAPLAPTPLGHPTIDLHVGDPPPVVQRRVHWHDGFYLRSSVGLVLARTSVRSEQAAHPDYSVKGGGLGLDLMIGGTPSPGLAIGGALALQSYGHSGGSSASLGLLGVFVDGFPMPNQGLNVGGMLGFSASRTTRPAGVDALRARGLGMSAWIGEGWWVADDWSMGGMLRLSGALDKDGSHDKGPAPYSLESSSYELALLFTVLYH